jgi:predicted nucleotidyltransferase
MSRDAAALDIQHLRRLADQFGPSRPLFLTVSGAHLYGFPSPESDVDLRGAHLLGLKQVIGLRPARETHERGAVTDGLKVDLVSHDLTKYMRLLTAKNGYVLEQVFSPYVVLSWPGFERLRALARGSLNRSLYYHYRGWAHSRWKVFTSEEPKRAKSILNVYRILLTGTHLLEACEVDANLPRRAAERGLDFVLDLLERKRRGEATLERAEVERHAQRVSALEAAMLRAYQTSRLPDSAPNLDEMNDFLIRTRVEGDEGIT